MRKRILFVIENAEYGGGERTFAQIIKNIDGNKFEVFVACLNSGLFIEKIKDKAKVLPLDLTRQVNFSNIVKLKKIIKDNNIDIVHSQGARADFYSRVASRLARKGNLPVMISTVAMPPEGFDVNVLKKFTYITLDRLSEKFVDEFIVVSKTTKEQLIEKHKIPLSKVIVIPNGLELDEYIYKPEWSEKIRREFNIKPGAVIIGTSCRLVWQKGLEYLIDSANILIKEFTDSDVPLVFLIGGEGPKRKVLELRVQKYGLEDRIIFTGFRKDVKEILSALDIFVMPSILEGQPIILIEVMAMGKPIVATDLDGIKEAVINGETGLLVPPKNPKLLADAIRQLIKDRNKWKQMGIRGREIIEQKYRLDNMIKKYEDLYNG